jgi:hypothetical protein
MGGRHVEERARRGALEDYKICSEIYQLQVGEPSPASLLAVPVLSKLR